MGRRAINLYEVDAYVAEIYDRTEAYTDDVEQLRTLMDQTGPFRILEPFCGTGRILISLALDGHELVGFDQAKGMLERARRKIGTLPQEVALRINLFEADVIGDAWPEGFDLVVLGANCFYELATAKEQEHCIAMAAKSLRPGGHVYIDNNHMEGELAESWRSDLTTSTNTCTDGTVVEESRKTIRYDAPRRLVRFHRRTRITPASGNPTETEWIQQKHPVSTVEVKEWLESHGFTIEHLFGGRAGQEYSDESRRAIFWAKKR